MRNKFIITIIAFSFLLACKKTSQPAPINVQTSDVYVAGVAYNSSTSTTACYWKNDQVVNLGVTGTLSLALDIAVVNNDVYVVGYTTQVGSLVKRAALWKNGVLKLLTTAEGSAQSVSMHNGIVYVVGEVRDVSTNYSKAFIWNSGTDLVTELNTVLSNVQSNANSIKYQGNEQLITGHINYQATLWKNGVPSTITDPNFTSSDIIGAAATGNTYYLVGFRAPIGVTSPQFGYWKQTSSSLTFRNVNSFGVSGGLASQIALKSDTLIIVGYLNTAVYSYASLTKINTTNDNYVTTQLTTGSAASHATDVFVDGNNIYVSVNQFLSSGNKANYWKNDVLKTLPLPGGFSNADSHALFVHTY